MVGKFLWQITAILFLFGSPLWSDDRPPVKLADYLEWETAGSPVISPNGKYILFSKRKVDAVTDSYASTLQIMNSDGSGAVEIGRAWSPTWIDNDTVAYFRRGEEGSEYVKRDFPSSDPVTWGQERVIKVSGGRLSSVSWSPDRKQMAFVSSVDMESGRWDIELPEMPEGAKWKAAPVVIDGLQYRTGVNSWRNKQSHLFVVPAGGGEARQLTSGNWNVGAFYAGIAFGRTLEWDKDGSSLVIEGTPEGEDSVESWQISDLYRVNVETGERTQLTRLKGNWRLPRISPDGAQIAYVGYEFSDDAFPVRQIRIMDRDGSNDRLLFDDTPDRVFRMQWHPDGDRLLVSFNENGSTNLVSIDMFGTRRGVATGPYRFTLGNIGGRKAVGSWVSLTRSREVALVDLDRSSLKVITNQNPVLQNRRLGEVDMFWSTSSDGTKVQNWVVKPVDYDPEKTYPLIVDIHGGPDLMYGYEIDFRYHEFASRGYLVLYSNPRGSTGYGAEFANAIKGGFPGNAEVLDLTASVEHAKKHYSIDDQRSYVMGCSGGGTLAAWMTAKTDIFAASTVMCPVINWASFLGTSDVTTWAYTRFSKPFWEDLAKWQEHSVITYVDSISAPTLIATGARDGRTPVSQSAELYTALKLRGIPTKMLIFPNAGHGPWRSIPSDLMRLQLYIDDWFSSYSN